MIKWKLDESAPNSDYFVSTKKDLRSVATGHDTGQRKNRPDSVREPLVLIVDDSEDDRIMMSRMLRRAGFRVLEAVTGDEALQAFEEWQPQVVLLDLFMPGMGGFTACRLLRMKPAGEQATIVMLTGLNDAGTVRRAYDAGVTEFIEKPRVGSTLEDYARLADRLRALCRNQSCPGDNGIE